MSNKQLIIPQLDKLEKLHTEMLIQAIRTSVLGIEGFHRGWLDAIEQFRLMLDGVDVTVGLEVDDETSDQKEVTQS